MQSTFCVQQRLCAHMLINTLRFFFAENRFTTKRERSRRSTPVEPNIPTSCQFLRRRQTMENNSSKDLPAGMTKEEIKRKVNEMPSADDLKRHLENFDPYDDERIRALFAKFNIQDEGPNLAPDAFTLERITIAFPLGALAMAPLYDYNPAGLNLTEGRKGVALMAFASVVPPGEKYDLIRRAHYQAMLKLFQVEDRYNFKNKSLSQQRSFVKRYINAHAVNELIELETKIDQMQQLGIMEGDKIHPEILALAADWRG